MHWIATAGLAAIAVGFSGLACAHAGGGGSGGHGSNGGGGHHGRGYHGRGVTGGDNRSAGSRRHGGGDGYGWYSGRFYGGPGGFPYGLLFASIPWYCETYWWGGVPYYYAEDTYYQWNDSAGAYETVQPPPGLVDQVRTQAPRRELFIFPEAGQSNEQLARDREDCHRRAVAQVGFDPGVPAAGAGGTAATGSSSADSTAAKRMEYLQADGACLMDRNYTVE